MDFNFTPEEAQPIAERVINHYTKLNMQVGIETTPWSNAPLRTTLTFTKLDLHILVEAQGKLNYYKTLQELASWLALNRCHAELYLATSSEATLTAGVLEEIKRYGTGLLVVDEAGNVSVTIQARNAALVITPDPTLKYGNCKSEVEAALNKFNNVDRKGGFSDMCEIVERETEKVTIIACRKRGLTLDTAKILNNSIDWESQINALASSNTYQSGHTPVISSNTKADLLAFKSARNLVQHKARSRKDEVQRQRQLADKMMMGTRLVSDLVSLRRKIS